MQGKMSYEDAVAQSLNAGCDFSDREFETHIPAAVRKGLLTEERLNDAVYRVMRDRFRLGEFDPPEMVPYGKISPSVICSPVHRALALKAARESMVLLSNKGDLLPLDKSKLKRIAVIGPHADAFYVRRIQRPGGQSGQSAPGNQEPCCPRNRSALRQGLPASHAVSEEGRPKRLRSLDGGTNDEARMIKEAAATAGQADVVIVCVGTNSAVEREGNDRTSLGLPGRQEELIKAVLAANSRTVVVLLNAGPLTIPWVKDNVPAILEAWWNGVEGGHAIADVLFGDYSPAGRLPHTVYASEGQVPSQTNTT